ncbi:MAG: isoleucine--tRNA ligase [Lachnospiraceae bacterium]|nr:isoleucine--tRNA ligase [Lachnospiraceae bacterium]
MYKKVETDLNFVEREKATARFWKDHDIFRKSIEQRKDCPTYMFFDGPPTANGKPHIGHVLTRVIKDMIPRYHAMKGELVPRKAGWDTHGLPVEIEVEKIIGIEGKEAIEEYGVEPFIEKCKESVWKYEGMWREFSEIVGFWADMDNPYVTYHDDFIESEWWALKQIFDRGLLYKGYKVVPYCPSCGTPLSSHEVAQGYKTLKEKSAVVRFKAKDGDFYYLAWTTTPWTLPSNCALCVNPHETYVMVKDGDDKYVLAKALVPKVFGENADVEILEEYVGTDLERREYEPLYKCAADVADAQGKKAHFVTCDEYVTMTDGTGIVHIAPAFGEDDARIGRNYDLPLVKFVDEQGKMTEETPFAGMRCKPTEKEMKEGAVSADPEVLKDLKARGLLVAAPKFEHDYPHCWRCGTPLIYYARESWFIRMTEVKDELVANNKKINWIPKSIGEGRFGDWLENIQDWALSRDRYWGTPLPVWICDDCGHQHAIGSKAELKEMSDNCPDDIELHKPFIDRVTLKCPHCGGTMRRVPEVIDCWFDSGSMPFAQHHYPFENQELFKAQFPASFISEAVDQTRGWFYSLHAISTLIFGQPCFENVIVLGLVQDENGQKMSKSKGNAVDPMEALAKYGADAIRWYFIVNSAPWLPSRFYGKAVQEGQSKFLGTLWNTYAFYVLYANIDNFNPNDYALEYDKLAVIDKWILSRLNSTIKEVDANMAAYRIPESGKALQAFVDDLSNWYVRRSRTRFWAKGMEQDKINAYMTLYTSLVTVSKLAAPMVPFMTEEIYQNLVAGIDANAPESIHLCDYPAADESMIDPELEENMDHVMKIVVLGRAARNASGIKNRQPIAKMMLKASYNIPEFFEQIILEELNIKKIELTDEADSFIDYTFKPQLKTVGPKYGKLLGGIRKALSELDGRKAMGELKAAGEIKLDINGSEVVLSEDDLLISMAQTEGFESQTDGMNTVVIDKELTPELLEEGFVRELISKIQTMRKEAGFEVMDRIKVYASGNEKIQKIMLDNKETIAHDVLTDEFIFGESAGYVKNWKINSEPVELGVLRQ